MLKIVKIIKTKWQERKLKKELNKHLIALDDAYDELISNRALSLWYHWTPEKYELLYDRIINHDLDKFISERNFEAYRAYLYPINHAEKEAYRKRFENVVEMHKKQNRHHWEARVNDNPDTFTETQEIDCLEEVLDLMARMKEKSLDYFLGFKNNMGIPPVQKDFIERILFNIYKDGEKENENNA